MTLLIAGAVLARSSDRPTSPLLFGGGHGYLGHDDGDAQFGRYSDLGYFFRRTFVFKKLTRGYFGTILGLSVAFEGRSCSIGPGNCNGGLGLRICPIKRIAAERVADCRGLSEAARRRVSGSKPSQAGDSKEPSHEIARPQRISKILCIKILFAAIQLFGRVDA